jgi:predicted regulator of Ras-like GTPase activity (Roadblock/LC7/MglB family)
MSFSTTLRKIVDGCTGVVGAALMGTDGIAIEQVAARRPAGEVAGEDIATAGTEFGRILEEIRKASDAIGGGAVRETAIHLARVTLVFHAVDDEIFVVVALAPDGNLGKARYLIRQHLLALRQEL